MYLHIICIVDLITYHLHLLVCTIFFPAVDLVLDKLPITMDGHTLEVEVHSPVTEEPVPLCTVEVRGPAGVIGSEMLEMYFESERRSGGGDITECEKQESVAYITFMSEEGILSKDCLFSLTLRLL